MKKYIRIISSLLAVVMLLGAFTAFSTVSVSAAADDRDEVIKNTYVKTVYNTPEEKAELVDEIEKACLGDIDTALDSIIAIQESLIGGESE